MAASMTQEGCMSYTVRDQHSPPWFSHSLVHNQTPIITTCISTYLLSANRALDAAEKHVKPSETQAQTIKCKPAIQSHRNRNKGDLAGRGSLKHANLCKGSHKLNVVFGGNTPCGTLRRSGPIVITPTLEFFEDAFRQPKKAVCLKY